METIQVVLDKQLLAATDEVARREKVNRSALVRTALRRHLKQLRLRDLERRDREGYQSQPDASDEWAEWEREAAWPEE